MISFYPGPSRIHDEVPSWVKDAHRKGILEMSHRSPEFIKLSKKTIALLKKRLKVPDPYLVFFAGSATECWEIIAQSVVNKKSIHIYNGAFGAKWHDYTRRLKPLAQAITFDLQQPLNPDELIFTDGDVICLTHNETSNGTQVSNKLIAAIRNNNPAHVLTVDATSSMAGTYLDFKLADIWFASVQKCFGLPAGLSVMICSPHAIDRMKYIGEKDHYNSLLYLLQMMEKWQTPFTPNVLGIYLLQRSLEKADTISKVDKKIIGQKKEWIRFFRKSKRLSLLVQDPEVMSNTVVAVTGSPDLIKQVKAAAKKKGCLLGDGYGEMKSTTFRIANFPALEKKEIARLRKILSPYI